MQEQNVAAVVKLLRDMPAWADMEAPDEKMASAILAAMQRIAGYDVEVIRTAVARYLDEERARPQGLSVAAQSKLYVLTRYLFRSTSREPLGQRRYGAFRGIPQGDTWVDELWPLSQDRDGQLRLTGTFGGYVGEEYLALQEFDAFQKRFGPRRR